MKTRYFPSPLLLLAHVSHTNSQSFAFHDVSFSRSKSPGRKELSLARLPRYHGGAVVDPAKTNESSTVPRAGQQVRLFRKKKQIYAALVPILTIALLAGSAHAASTAIPAQKLGWRNLWSSTIVLVSIGALPLSYFGVTALAKSLLISASRCALQVSLLGSVVLQKMMGVTKPGIVGAWILGVGLIASREATSRIQYTYPDMKRNMYASVLTSGLMILGLTASLSLFGHVKPWFDPRTWIPIAGMLFGNTLNASALSASSITKQFATDSDAVELRLTRGASAREAIAPLVEESYRIALMPTINSLAATGIIHIPGMMSGQILAGQSPQQAALYQIVIIFLISATAILSVQLIINSTIRSIVDTRESRLRHGILELKENAPTKSNSSSSESEGNQRPALVRKSASPMKLNAVKYSRGQREAPVLEIKDLAVTRANTVVDLVLHPGDRIAIAGKSGAGKSQILRTVIGLEESSGENRLVSLFGNAVGPCDLPRFRSRVCLVPPNKPTLEGTPNQFFHQILKWQSQGDREQTPNFTVLPSDIAKHWDLGAGAFDQDWRTLSGGESQRAALAIALALEPDVLLLDESISFLDEKTSLLVEGTLRKSNIPILIVTHSEDQLKRFCTHKLDM